MYAGNAKLNESKVSYHEDRILEYFAFGNLGIMISKAIRMLRALALVSVAWFRKLHCRRKLGSLEIIKALPPTPLPLLSFSSFFLSFLGNKAPFFPLEWFFELAAGLIRVSLHS